MSTGGNPPSGGDIFDVKRIRRLIELMNEYDLAEVDLRQAEQRIRLRKGADPVVSFGPAPALPMAPAPVAAAPVAAATPAAPPHVESNQLTIKSPVVGTFYASSSPDVPPFVKVGDRVGPTSTVCIIEAMKVFNEIPAEVSGQIVQVLVENGAAVEYGQPLFKVDPGK